MPRNMLDGITEFAPGLLVIHDLDTSSYTGNARFSQGFFDQCVQLGHPVVLMIQETVSERSQQGYQAGVYDVQFARARAKQRGFTGPIAYVVSDGWRGNVWDSSEYGRGVSDTEEGQFLGYGAKGVLDSFYRGAHVGRGAHLIHPAGEILDGDWGPETWGDYSLITQLVGPSPVPDTDLNIVHHPLGTSAPSTPFPTSEEDDDMLPIVVIGHPTDEGVWIAAGADLVKLPSVNALQAGRSIVVNGQQWDAGFHDQVKAGLAKLAGSGGGSGSPLPVTPLPITLTGNVG